MRTDCEISTTEVVDLPQIPQFSFGRKTKAQRGDLVWWKLGDYGRVGRVIGVVRVADPDKPGPHLCVAMLSTSGQVSEHWVNPADVIDCEGIDHPTSMKKLCWLFGSDFLSTPVDKARQCNMLRADELIYE